MRIEQVTIKDLAKALNVSVSTVSRALRNAPDINPETREAVLKLAAELNYEPNYIAQSLVRKQTKVIGVIVPAIHSNYFSQALSGMTDAANQHKYHVMFCQSNENAKEEMAGIKKLISTNVDGLLISVSKGSANLEELDKIREKGVPIVMYDRIIPEFSCTKVIVDEYEGAFNAVEHLIKKGCKKIAHLAGPADLSVSVNRLNGYNDALKKYNLDIDPSLIVPSNAFEDDALRAVKKIWSTNENIDGIFCINDLSAIIAIKFLQGKNIKVPEQVKVVGFNDDPVSRYVEPTLSTVMQPGYEVGKLAMGILIDEINSQKSSLQTYKLRTKLIKRNSSK